MKNLNDKDLTPSEYRAYKTNEQKMFDVFDEIYELFNYPPFSINEKGYSNPELRNEAESELSKIIQIPQWVQDFLKPFDACIPIPTWKSFMKIAAIAQNPLKDPVYTVIGEPIEVQKIEEPSEQDILDLKQKYIDSLKQMYKREMGRDLKVI